MTNITDKTDNIKSQNIIDDEDPYYAVIYFTMKTRIKFLFVLSLLLVLSLSSVFATQETYRLSSDEVQTFLLLRKASETATPDPTYPISATQLAGMLEGLDTTKLDSNMMAKYQALYEELTNKKSVDLSFDTSILVAEAIKGEDKEDHNIVPFKDREPLLDVLATVNLSDYFTGVFDADVRTTIDAYDKNCLKGIYLNTLKNIGSLSTGFPTQAYASVGYNTLNLTVGRDRLGNGNGYTGNLVFGENILFEDFVKFSYAGDKFSYDFTIDSFSDKARGDFDLEGIKKNIYLHRFSYAITKFMNVTLYEGAIVKTTSIVPDMKLLNPFMIIHNFGSFYNGSTNNFFGLETTAQLPLAFQINGQFFVDQILSKKLFDEKVLNSGESAFAALLNVSKLFSFKKSVLDVYAEAVYGNPYVYLKNSHGYGLTADSDFYKYLDYVADVPYEYRTANSMVSKYIGYKYGGDLFAAAIGANYTADNLKVSGDLRFLAKGNYGIYEDYNERRISLGRDPECLADTEFDQNYKDYENIVEKSLTLDLSAKYTLFDSVDLSAALATTFYNNYKHTIDGKPFGLQFATSIVVRPIELVQYIKNN